MKDLFPSSIRSKLLLIGALAFLPFLLLTLANSSYQRKQEIAAANARMQKILDLAVLHEEEMVRDSHQILSVLSEMPSLQKGGGSADAFLQRLLKRFPRYTNFVVCRPDGGVIASAVPVRTKVNFSDRPFFQEAMKSRSFTVGDFVVGRITGKPIVVFANPAIDPNGEVTAVLLAPLDLTRESEFETRIGALAPENSSYVKLDHRGSILIAYPETPLFRKGHVLEDSLFGKVSREKAGNFTATGADGAERLLLFSAYRSPLNREGGYVLLAIPTKDLFRGVDRLALAGLAVVFLGAVLFIAILWIGGEFLIVRPAAALASASRRLADGDLTARSGLRPTGGEIGALGRAFDKMAEEIERREEESRKMQGILLRSAEAAEAERARTEAIIAAIGDGVSIQDREFRVLFQNDVHRQLIGDHRGEFCYQAYENQPNICEGCPVATAFDRGGVVTTERHAVVDGVTRVVEITASPVRNAAGEIVAGVEVVRDISDRRKGEEERARLAMAVDQSAEAVVITDRDGTIRYVNPAFVRISGYSREEAAGKNPRILKSGKHDVAFYRRMWETLLRGEVWNGRIVNRKKDGRFYEEEATISPVRDSSGEIVSFVAVKRDVTRIVALEQQVRMAQKMESVGTLAGGVAHDFNNVLTVILGYGEMLRSRLADDPKAAADLEEILRAAERASVLTRQLLTFARRQIIEPVHLDLNRVVADLEKLLRKVTREDIVVKVFPAPEPMTIRADRGQVEQILMNLCLNSRDAMPEGGQLIIETGTAAVGEEYLKQYPYMREGRYVVLSVSDTGIGMDEKTRERVFEPFFTTKGPDRGTGLGLAVVYGIVKQHNGFIHIYSEPGKGSTFRVYFPAADALPDPEKKAARADAPPAGTETILLAEDEEPVRNMMERTLKSCGYRLLVARDGVEAVELFRRHGPEIALVVLDVVMPKKGGKQAYDEMSAERPGLKVLMLSGYSANAIHESFILLPGLPFLQKPFIPDALARKVREVLDGK